MRNRNNAIGLAVALSVAAFLITTASIKAMGQEQVLHAFNGRDGGLSGTGLIFDAAGNLYGSTGGGGRYTRSCSAGCGVVFKLSPGANGWTETVLHYFNGTDGFGPSGVIFDAVGNLYGTTSGGGRFGCGNVFKLSPGTNGEWTEIVLHSFNNTNGDVPSGGVIFDAPGNLYGVTQYGAKGVGNVFKLTPGADGKWTETVLHSFYNVRAASPSGSLVFDSAGSLYGTASAGGRFLRSCPGNGCGSVFRLAPAANGKWTYNVLREFDSTDGATPYAGLILDAVGNLYGTTVQGGEYGSGVVFKLSPGAHGKWTETVLHSFDNNDGKGPFSGSLIFDAAGNLYGTTFEGGEYGFGTVFKLTPGANGTWTETLLYEFGNGSNGLYPYANLIFDAAGNLYSTTARGGNQGDCAPFGGCGVVFEITP